jgi:solute carrier family 35 protein C2
VLNKKLVGKDQGNFNRPLFLSCIHSLVHYIVTSAFYCYPTNTIRRLDAMSTKRYLFTFGPTALCSSLDIGLSNSSLHYISLSFYTMIKSSVPVWALLFAFLFRLEKVCIQLILIIFVICFGVVFTIAGEVRFSLNGIPCSSHYHLFYSAQV